MDCILKGWRQNDLGRCEVHPYVLPVDGPPTISEWSLWADPGRTQGNVSNGRWPRHRWPRAWSPNQETSTIGVHITAQGPIECSFVGGQLLVRCFGVADFAICSFLSPRLVIFFFVLVTLFFYTVLIDSEPSKAIWSLVTPDQTKNNMLYLQRVKKGLSYRIKRKT